MTTASDQREEAEAVAVDDSSGAQRRQARTRASSIATASPNAPRAVTLSVRARATVARGAAWLDRPESLVHARPPSLATARTRHHETAGRHELWTLVKFGRLAWGYFHLVFIAAPLRFLEWVTETPLRFAALVVLITVLWIWS